MSTVVDPNTDEHADATHGDAPASAAPEVLTCPNCSAPAEPGQLMCLECGSRLALDYDRPPTWRLPVAIVGVVVLLAGLGVAIALAATGNDSKPTAAATPTQTAAQPAPASPGDAPPTASQPTPAPASSTTTPAPAAGAATATASTPTPAPTPSTPPSASTTGWPPGKSAFTVVLASMPSKSDADTKLAAARAAE